jgi:hypothetical protein
MTFIWNLLIIGGFAGAMVSVMQDRTSLAMLFCTIVLFAAVVGRPR